MTTATLRDKLTDDHAEVRRAAAIACASKSDKSLIPDLISLLGDREALVGRAAHAALKHLSGQEFERDAIEQWRTWWKKQGGDFFKS